MATPFSSIVARALVCCAVVIVPSLWASLASARDWSYNYLVRDSQNQNLCLNNPYQSDNNGNPLVVTPHCDYSDPGSAVFVEHQGGSIVLHFVVSTPLGFLGANPNKCMDNQYDKQQDFNPIVIWDCNGGGTQQWDLTSAGELRYHPNPAYCATVNNTNGNLQLYRCIGQSNQQFAFVKEPFTQADFTKCYSEEYFHDTRQCNIAGANGGNAGCYSVAGSQAYQHCKEDLGQ